VPAHRRNHFVPRQEHSRSPKQINADRLAYRPRQGNPRFNLGGTCSRLIKGRSKGLARARRNKSPSHRMSNCDLVTAKSLIDLTASRLALRAPGATRGYGLDSTKSISALAIMWSTRCAAGEALRTHQRYDPCHTCSRSPRLDVIHSLSLRLLISPREGD
jgi:hypothetical protein